jgi:hypothetical protein
MNQADVKVGGLEKLIKQAKATEQRSLRAVRREVVAKLLLSFKPEVVTHASQSQRPVLGRMCDSGAAYIHNPAQPPIMCEKVLQGRITVREATPFRHRRKRSEFVKNAF